MIPEQKTPFRVDEMVIVHSSFSDSDFVASFRGDMFNGNCVVWSGKMQFVVPLSRVRHQQTAKFIGWCAGVPDDVDPIPPFAEFNVVDENGHENTTVGVETLQQMGIDVPAHPSFDEWEKIKR